MYHRKSIIGIIEDDQELRETLGHLLAHYGYVSALYPSAGEFVPAAKTADYACLLIDINLDRMSGLELGRRLSEMGCTVPIIFMTGLADADIQAEAWKLGCVAVLRKPFFPNELLDALSNATKPRS